jgi:cytochrome b subunit of formate dehydrogenase/nitrate/TMAO reductase-like tetraheme cytochrome c subunit
MTRSLAWSVAILCALPAWAGEEDESCLKCHTDRAALEKARTDPKRSLDALLVDRSRYERSVHASRGCADCHFDYDTHPHGGDAETAACSECHEEAAETLAASVHGTAENAATCKDCHGVHDILKPTERDARLYPLNVYRVCGQCHLSVDIDTASVDELLHDPYTDDSHARGILKAGLAVSATCVSCHGGHGIKPHGDPESRVARHRVDQVCGECHIGVLEEYRQSVHHLKSNGTDHEGATCSDCHRPHTITSPTSDFRAQTIATCSECHTERGDSFSATYHGKRSSLGSLGDAAACGDCHSNHRILPLDDPASAVNPANIVATCGRCHEGSHEEFTTYLVHADMHDGENYPRINAVYVIMNTLLIMTLILGGLHALLWLIRALAAGEWRRPPVARTERYIRRWPRVYVFYHMALMTCVLMLASTGLPLHYAERPWATSFMSFFGGVDAAGYVHRVFAVAMVVLFVFYLLHIGFRLVVRREKGMFFGGNTMLPRWKDLQDLLGNLRWFLFRGERPRYDRWTYWEKFDFWAVFWGMFVIGLTGLILWFPVEATRFVPGWFINAAIIIHGIEALLDIAFIFSVHVFHANFRPDKFPMDTMYWSGRISEKEFRHERPVEYERLVQSGTLDAQLTAQRPRRATRTVAYIIGTCALAIGFFFVAMMIVAVVQGPE